MYGYDARVHIFQYMVGMIDKTGIGHAYLLLLIDTLKMEILAQSWLI